MKALTCFGAALFLTGVALSALVAQAPRLLPPVSVARGQDAQPGKGVEKLPAPGKQPDKNKLPDKEKKLPDPRLTEPSPFEVFARTGNPFGEVRSGFNPHMLGDLFGKFSRRTLTVFTTTTTTITDPKLPSGPAVTTGPITTTTTSTRTILVPIVTGGAFKVAENASPRPQDRVFMTYNYYDGLRHPDNGSTLSSLILGSSDVTAPGTGIRTVTDSRTVIPAGAPFVNLHRETFGFEKTFLDGYASIEVRLPLLQQQSGIDTFTTSQVGDLTINGKYAFLLDRNSGDVISGGLAITAPTGPSILTDVGNVHSTLFQPWFGYIWNFQRTYIQGFHSVVVPSDSRDVTLLFNDVSFNYWLYYRDQPSGIVNFIVPTIEAHVTTPLNNRGDTAILFAADQLVLTGGVHIGLFRNSTLTFGAATPVTGPNLYNVEAFVQFNRRF